MQQRLNIFASDTCCYPVISANGVQSRVCVQ